MTPTGKPDSRRPRSSQRVVPKVIGADFELGNLILGPGDADRDTCYEASRAILAEIDGVPNRRPHRREGSRGHARTDGYNEQEWGRRFLPGNGGCAYVDLDHAEMNTPEVLSAWEHVATVHAMLRIARAALYDANRRLPSNRRIVVLANNSDGKGHSYGSHLSFLISRDAWAELFDRRMYPAVFYLMSFQVSSVVYTGQGKVGAENGRPWVPFQISQRADFFETLVGPQTTYRRPLVNTRDEPHCGWARYDHGNGRGPGWARLHCIFFDQALCHGTLFLRAGPMQLVLAMIEAGWIDPGLLLDDPLAALWSWSADPDLRARARLHSGARVNAVELQLLFLDQAKGFVDAGKASGSVPDAAEILEYWGRTLSELHARDFDALARKLDWVRKRSLLERAMAERPGLDWSSPEIAHLDQIYGSLDESEGLYWACERDRAVDVLVPASEIERLVHEPPSGTRAWSRAALLRSIPREKIVEMDWSYVRVRRTSNAGSGSVVVNLGSPVPEAATPTNPGGEHDGT